jgi:hypothetical protein
LPKGVVRAQSMKTGRRKLSRKKSCKICRSNYRPAPISLRKRHFLFDFTVVMRSKKLTLEEDGPR